MFKYIYMPTNTNFINFTGINQGSTTPSFYGLVIFNQSGSPYINSYLLITSTDSPGNLLTNMLGNNLNSPSGNGPPGYQFYYLNYTTYGMAQLYSQLSNSYYLYVARSGSIMRFNNISSGSLTSVTFCSIATLYTYTGIVTYKNSFLFVSATDGIYQVSITDSTNPTGTASLWVTNAQINSVLTCGSSSIYGLAVLGTDLYAMIKGQGIVKIQINTNNTLGTISIHTTNSLITSGSALLAYNNVLYIGTQNTPSTGSSNYGTGNIYTSMLGSNKVEIYKSNTYYPANSGLATDGVNLYLLCAGNSGVNSQASYVSIYPLAEYVYQLPETTIVCFKEDSLILTDQGYRLVQELRKGDLVRTEVNGYVPVYMIAKREMYHPASQERIKDQLYECSPTRYPELFEPLIITGCHSILVDDILSEEQLQKSFEVNGGHFSTNQKYRLPACVDERTTVFNKPGTHTIYHFALDNDDYYSNYGVYANGLLVETCSKRYLTELANMELIE